MNMNINMNNKENLLPLKSIIIGIKTSKIKEIKN